MQESDGDRDLSSTFSISTPTLTVLSGPPPSADNLEPLVAAPAKRKRRTKAEMEAARVATEIDMGVAEPPIMESATQAPETHPIMESATQAPETHTIRVTPKHGRNLYCHTQQKMIYAGFETLVLRDKWILKQIKLGTLVLV